MFIPETYTETATVEELQAVGYTIAAELRLRFTERQRTCQHPVEARGQVLQERPGNRMDGCTYCLTLMAADGRTLEDVMQERNAELEQWAADNPLPPSVLRNLEQWAAEHWPGR